MHALIDAWRARCDDLSGYKKDIALFALGKTCLSGKGGFGHFSSSTGERTQQDTPEAFTQRLRSNIARINALVFDNGEKHCAYRGDINAILPKVKTDLAYFDPPYATAFSTTHYEKAYHFIEGLMTYWDDLTINPESKNKHYHIDYPTVTKGNAEDFFQQFLGHATHISQWLISYRDHAYPDAPQMKKILQGLGRQSRMHSKEHQYSITAKRGEASQAKERLFVCRPASSAQTAAELADPPAPLATAANIHTSIPVELCLDNDTGLNTDAMHGSATGDPQFSFILCRTGTNRNGDHFTAEELSTRYATAINKKVDLQHSQAFGDIIGGIVAAEYRSDNDGGHIECVGELYTADTPQAQLAYKLIKRGIITQVSMECDYTIGECSICHKQVKSKADYCTHLRQFKGRTFEGEPVFEILHGVTFTGLGLLDRQGADEQARILQVAAHTASQPPQGTPTMDDHPSPPDPAATTTATQETPPAKDTAPDSALEKENRQLKAQVAELQKRIQELEAAQQAAAAHSRAQQLMVALEQRGIDWGEGRDAECQRLAALSDEAFTATEAAYTQLLNHRPATSPPTATPASAPPSPATSTASMHSAATPSGSLPSHSMRPHDIDDRPPSLEERLRSGLMAAYHHRVGDAVNDTIDNH